MTLLRKPRRWNPCQEITRIVDAWPPTVDPPLEDEILGGVSLSSVTAGVCASPASLSTSSPDVVDHEVDRMATTTTAATSARGAFAAAAAAAAASHSDSLVAPDSRARGEAAEMLRARVVADSCSLAAEGKAS